MGSDRPPWTPPMSGSAQDPDLRGHGLCSPGVPPRPRPPGPVLGPQGHGSDTDPRRKFTPHGSCMGSGRALLRPRSGERLCRRMCGQGGHHWTSVGPVPLQEEYSQ
eukprot:1264442-Pyramimonas_sp.AAC.1